jgi:C4-dicarboxylate transporter DctM subunit
VNANTDSAALPPEATGASETLFPSGSRRDRPGALALTIGFGLVAVCLAGLFTSPSAAIGGAWCIAMMLVLLFLSVPVAIALSVPSIIGVYAVSGIPATMNILATAPFSAVSDWTLSVLPMFIFMGMLLTRSGLSTKIYRVADHWFSWLPGGIGIGTTFAGAGLSAVTGSTIGMTYALGRGPASPRCSRPATTDAWPSARSWSRE